jgi:large subunit ribosomal protein L29
MSLSEYAAMERSELEDKLVESRKELFNLRFQKATGQLDNTARIGNVKKDVARILTLLRQQDLGIAEDVTDVLSVARARPTRRPVGPGETVDESVDEEAEQSVADEDEEEA